MDFLSDIKSVRVPRQGLETEVLTTLFVVGVILRLRELFDKSALRVK